MGVIWVPANSTGSERRRGASKRRAAFGFNAKSREAHRWAKKYAGERITKLNDETKINIRKMIADSIRDGVPPRESAKLIRDAVGLNRPQGIALRRYVRELSPTLSTAAKAKAGIRLKNKMIRRRAITIARTEIIDSLSAGVEQAWTQAQGKGLLGKHAKKEWVTTPFGACNVCRPLNGSSVLLGENFESVLGPLARPTAHPNCRCGLAPVPGAGGAVAPPPAVQATGASVSTMARMAVNADGDLLKGADARKAILKYVDDPDLPLNKRINKLEVELAELNKKLEEEAPKLFEQSRMYEKLLRDTSLSKTARETELESIFNRFFYDPKSHIKSSKKISERIVRDPKTGKHWTFEEIDKARGEARRLADTNRVIKDPLTGRIWKVEDLKKEAHRNWTDANAMKNGLRKTEREYRRHVETRSSDLMEKFIYNKTRNRNVDIEEKATFKKPYTDDAGNVIDEKKSYNEAKDSWERMVDDELFSYDIDGPVQGGKASRVAADRRSIFVKRNTTGDRANAAWDDNFEADFELKLQLGDVRRYGRSVTVHEFTHTVEFANPDVLAEAIRWRDSFTAGEKLTMMSKLTKDPTYKKWETGYGDGDEFFHKYIGKVYNRDSRDLINRDINQRGLGYKQNKVYTKRDGWQDATEVSTMGMQFLYHDPVKLAREAPSLFDFVYERIIRRKYTHDTSTWSLRAGKDIDIFRLHKGSPLIKRFSRRGSMPRDYYFVDEVKIDPELGVLPGQ